MLQVNNKSIVKIFKKYDIETKVKYLHNGDLTVRYLILNDDKHLPTLFFIHGAPGYILDLKSYFKIDSIRNHARIIAVERPGYGYSNYGHPLTSIREQANIIGQILKKELQQPASLIAHSYGGPIAAKIAIDHPRLVQKLFLLAPALDPENEKIFKIAYLAKVSLFKKIIPVPLLVAAEEKFYHVEELEKLKTAWERLEVPVDYFHGTNDWIVPYKNLHFAQKHFKNADANFITLPGANHFINYFPRKEIVSKITELLHV